MTACWKLGVYLGAASLTAAVQPAFGLAQSTQSATARTLLRYEDDWAKALVRRDTIYFRRMLAPGFVYTEDSAVMTADDVVRGREVGQFRGGDHECSTSIAYVAGSTRLPRS